MPTAIELPIHAFIPQIQNCLAAHSACILQAEPGAGKSTQVPLALMDADWLQGRKIILLEPRRLAVRSLAGFLAKQLGEKVGQRIGYQVRNDRKISKETIVEIMTEGILIRRLQNDPELSDTALIIFDEFHERSLDSDLALALCLDSQSALREDLKLLIMSATIASDSLSTFLDNAPVIQCPGRTFPVNIHYLPSALPQPLSQLYGPPLYRVITQALTNALNLNTGDCLIFLPGQKEILQAIQHASESINPNEVALIPLYGGLTPEAQSKVLQKDAKNRRKVIFSTNIAETSLTIEGIHIVIDSGLVRHAAYDASSGMTRMLTQNISQASAIQRSGRAGRLAEGHAYRLWTESDHKSRIAFTAESILTSDLTDLSLEMAMWGVTNLEDLRWLTPPPTAHYQIAQVLLIQLGFLKMNGSLNPLGEQASQLGLSARLAKMILIARQFDQKQGGENQLTTACDIAAILSERDILRRGVGVNLEDRVEALQAYRKNPQTLKSSSLIMAATQVALTNSQQWKKRALALPNLIRSQDTSIPLSIGQLLALAYPDRVAKRRSNADGRYQLSNGKGCILSPEDRLNDQAWSVVADLDGQRRDGKVFMAAPITLEEIESLFAQQITTETTVSYDDKKQRILGITHRKLGALSLQQTTTNKINPKQLQACMTEVIIASNLEKLPWNKTNQAWLDRVSWLGQYLPEYAVFSIEELVNDFDQWCLPYLSGMKQWSDLAKLDLLSLLQARLSYSELNAIEQYTPTHYTAPSGKRVAIHYEIGKLPKVAIQLQELFGELSSPKLANGKVALTFELLSPAQKPIQITADLANFWNTSYIEVAKEMRGKYRRHRWPEKPLEEKAGRSIQPRRPRTK
jgi:ATP-dependent helicase HrpB